MPSSESTRPGYVPAIGGAVVTGSILFSVSQSLSVFQQSVARANMGLGSASVMNAAPVASIASSTQLVRGDDLRWNIFSSKADISGGKLLSAQLPDHAVTVAVSVANQAARLALSAGAAIGRIFRDDDTKISHCLIAGGTPSNAAHWLAVGDSFVTLNDIQGITSLGIALCGAANSAAARLSMGLANVADASGVNVSIQGNLMLGNASANKLTIDVSGLAGPMTVNSSYRASGTYYWVLTTQADGTLALADVTGLTSALSLKADLVGGKVPLGQLPTIVGSLTASVSKANAAARLAMTSTDALGVVVVQADNKTSWMLVSGGVPSNPLDWLQVGDAEVRVAEIFDAGVTGQALLLCADTAAARAVLGLGENQNVTFSAVYATSGQFFLQVTTGVWRSINKPTSLVGSSGWTLPNRSGFLAYSANADGSLNGSDIAGGSPTFTALTTGAITISGIETHSIGGSELWLSGAFAATVTVATLTANRNHTIPNGSGAYALVASSTGAIAIADVGSLAATLAAKADLVSGRVPSSQLPANLATTESTIRASGLDSGRGVTSMANNAILATDMGTMLEVHLGITEVVFSGFATMSQVTPGCLDLWVRPTSVALSGAVVYDKYGTVITSLPAGVWHVVLLLEGLFTARYVVENYTLNALRDVVSEVTAANYTPDPAWRAGGASNELGAHLKGIDAAINATSGYAASCHYGSLSLLVGDNAITFGNPSTTGFVKYSVGAAFGVGYNEFTPSVDGVWRLRMEINILGNGGGAADAGLRMQSYNGTTWADVAGENIYFSNTASLKNYVLESVVAFQAAGVVRKIRYVVIGVPEDPPSSGACGELVERSATSPAIKFTATRS